MKNVNLNNDDRATLLAAANIMDRLADRHLIFDADLNHMPCDDIARFFRLLVL